MLIFYLLISLFCKMMLVVADEFYYTTSTNNMDFLLKSQEGFNFIEQALLRYKVLVLRNVSIDVEEFRTFSRNFGDLHIHLESSSHLPGYSDVNAVSNIRNNETGQINGLYGNHVEVYHSDLSWANLPTKITLLKSVIRPDHDCGDTHFLNTNHAYDDLDEELKVKLSDLQGTFCYLKSRKETDQGLTGEQMTKASVCAIHPIITTHPVTGRKNIYANPAHTASIISLPKEESDELLDKLFKHVQQDKYQKIHKWEDDDLIIWDNRAVHHRATGCPEAYPRFLIRITVLNEVTPV